ncbi:hypothetical protein [Herpetosiphon geysericola]|uniref:Uncharacterized protein n=1 Tax=Herpetosiphon geysericola TaxID=70996 RepID=A0A0N8GSC3_9CHLR|nr:hypothetical protein [Herpetosiphon geysericola]KPL88898.1 hypothetical protein SE18_09535 [Herpetosiphon geysericola]
MSEEQTPIEPAQPIINIDSQEPIITISQPYEYGRHPYPYNQRLKPNNDPQLGYFVPAIVDTRGQQAKRWGCAFVYVLLAIMASCIIVPILCILIFILRALFAG